MTFTRKSRERDGARRAETLETHQLRLQFQHPHSRIRPCVIRDRVEARTAFLQVFYTQIEIMKREGECQTDNTESR